MGLFGRKLPFFALRSWRLGAQLLFAPRRQKRKEEGFDGADWDEKELIR
jgi:hypothetical protein